MAERLTVTAHCTWRSFVAYFRQVGTKRHVLPLGVESGGRGRCTLSSPGHPDEGPGAAPLTEGWLMSEYPKGLIDQAPGHELELKTHPGQ